MSARKTRGHATTEENNVQITVIRVSEREKEVLELYITGAVATETRKQDMKQELQWPTERLYSFASQQL